MPLFIKTPTDWANALLGALGLPDTKNNVDNILAWWSSEGGAGPEFGVLNNTDSFNPLNTVLVLPGSVPTNSAGVEAYTSWTEGLDATVSELTQHGASLGAGDFQPIYDNLARNAPWAVFDQTGDWLNNISGLSPGQGKVESAQYKEGAASGAGTYSHYGDKKPVVPPGPSGPGGSSDTGPAGPTGPTTKAQFKAEAGPSAVKPVTFQGFAGVLQSIDAWMNPDRPGVVSSLTSLGGSDVKYVATLIFTRTASSLLFIGVAGIGVLMLVRGETAGGAISTGGGDVFEFVQGQERLTEQRLSRQERESRSIRSQETAQTRLQSQERQHASKERASAERVRERRNARIYKERVRRQRQRQRHT